MRRKSLQLLWIGSLAVWLTGPLGSIARPEADQSAEKILQQLAWQPQDKGTVALVSADWPGQHRAVIDAIDAGLRQAGYRPFLLDSRAFMNPLVVSPDRFDLVIVTGGRELPLETAPALAGFLKNQGNLIAIGTPLYADPSRRAKEGWMKPAEIRAKLNALQPTQMLYDFEAGSLREWTRSSNQMKSPVAFTCAQEGAAGSTRAMQVAIDDLTGWETFSAPPLGDRAVDPAQNVFHFWAKGGERTSRLAVECIERDGSRWIATVPLERKWTSHALLATDFVYWHDSPTGSRRGGSQDRLRFAETARITVGLSFTHTGTEGGRHQFWIDQLGFAQSPLADLAAAGPLDFPATEMLWPSYKCYRTADVRRVRPHPMQALIAAADLPRPAELWCPHQRPHGTGFNKNRPWRMVTVAEAVGNHDDFRGPALTLMLCQEAGKPAHGWATLGSDDPAFLAAPPVVKAVADLAGRMLDGVFLLEGGSEFYTAFPDEAIRAGAKVVNIRRRGRAEAEVRLRLLASGKELVDRRTAVSAKGGEEPVVVQERFDSRIPAGGCTVVAELVRSGRVIDRLQHDLDLWQPKDRPQYVTARDGDFYLGGRKWYPYGVNHMPASGIGTEDHLFFEHYLSRRSYDPEIFDRELARIKAMGMNMVSTFIGHDYHADRNLFDYLRRCDQHGLKVNLSLRPGTPMDFPWDKVREMIVENRLAQSDVVFAYDLAWEPFIGRQAERTRWDQRWRAWILRRYSTIEAAEKAWGFAAPRDSKGTITNPLDAHCGADGPWRKMVADYRRFIDEIVDEHYTRARELVRSVDPHHLVSFRMTVAGDPTYNQAHNMPYDFRSLARGVDLFEPEGYGRIGDWSRVRPGIFTVAYARAVDPTKPVIWAEFGVSSWDMELMQSPASRLESQGRFYQDFLEMALRSGANGAVAWWYPGGFRTNEKSDYGILNPDGTDRPATVALRKYADPLTRPREIPKPDVWIEFDPDHPAGIEGIYNQVSSPFWQAVESGKTPGLRPRTRGKTGERPRGRAVPSPQFTSDNGPHQEGGHQVDFFDSNGPLRGCKRDLYEGGVRVPGSEWWPGRVPAGAVSDRLSSFQDYPPRFCELANIPAFKTEGISLAPTLGMRPAFASPLLAALALAPLAGQRAAEPFVAENRAAKLVLDARGCVATFCGRDGTNLLASQPDTSFMSLRIGTRWHRAAALRVSGKADEWRLTFRFENTSITARAVLRVHRDYFEVETAGLDGAGSDAVEVWRFVQLPVKLTANVGTWLNVAWDESFVAAVIALEDRTEARGTPWLQAVAHRSLGLVGRRAAIIACPTPRLLPLVREIEAAHRLPSPTLGGQWAKTSREARKSWMITALSARDTQPAFTAQRVFTVAEDLGIEYVVIGLHWWNTSFGTYSLNTDRFPQGIDSLKAVADQAHARGLKLGLHVMTGSVTKNDPLVTPVPDARLCCDAEATLAADVDAAAPTVPVRESVAHFGTASGYWAYRGMDLQIDDEIIRYGGIGDGALSLVGCVRGAYGTRAAAHRAGAKVRHLTERYGWYVASPELAEQIGRNLADLINRAGLDMVCFDGADVTADPQTQFHRGHQVAVSLLAHARRDVLLVSNGSTHFGWHCMSRGGEDDAMARGFKSWVDDHTVHAWGEWHRRNFLIPDLSWVGIFSHTPTLTAARPDDVELVCARSLGYGAPIGWGFAACYGGPSTVETFSRNGRREEIAGVIRSYERLRLDNRLAAEVRQPLCKQGSEWRLLSAERIVPARYLHSGVVRAGAAWQVQNDLGEQPLSVRVEALPAVADFGTSGNVIVADFARLQFRSAGHPAAQVSLQVTGETHPQAGVVARLSCVGPAPGVTWPPRLAGHGQPAWAQASAAFPARLDLRQHRALGLWIKGDGSGATLNVQLELTPQSYLHFYAPITFTGWRYCELSEPEGDRVMDYFSYEKHALHDLKLDSFASITLMILNPPRGRNVQVELGRIEALRETGGQLANPRLIIGSSTLALPVTLEPGQYVETGDGWGTGKPATCRTFNADNRELRRLELASVPTLPPGVSEVRLESEGRAPTRAKVTVMLKGK